MNIKALPSVGSAFFVAFVLWSRRFAVPLQKESLGGTLGGALGGALVSSAPTEIGWYTITWLVHDYLVGALETSAPPGRT